MENVAIKIILKGEAEMTYNKKELEKKIIRIWITIIRHGFLGLGWGRIIAIQILIIFLYQFFCVVRRFFKPLCVYPTCWKGQMNRWISLELNRGDRTEVWTRGERLEKLIIVFFVTSSKQRRIKKIYSRHGRARKRNAPKSVLHMQNLLFNF